MARQRAKSGSSTRLELASIKPPFRIAGNFSGEMSTATAPARRTCSPAGSPGQGPQSVAARVRAGIRENRYIMASGEVKRLINALP